MSFLRNPLRRSPATEPLDPRRLEQRLERAATDVRTIREAIAVQERNDPSVPHSTALAILDSVLEPVPALQRFLGEHQAFGAARQDVATKATANGLSKRKWMAQTESRYEDAVRALLELGPGLPVRPYESHAWRPFSRAVDNRNPDAYFVAAYNHRLGDLSAAHPSPGHGTQGVRAKAVNDVEQIALSYVNAAADFLFGIAEDARAQVIERQADQRRHQQLAAEGVLPQHRLPHVSTADASDGKGPGGRGL